MVGISRFMVSVPIGYRGFSNSTFFDMLHDLAHVFPYILQ